MKLLFLSAFNLTTNPRLTKELQLATELGYTVDFVGIDLGGWSAHIDRQLIPQLQAHKMTFLPVTRSHPIRWFMWTAAEKGARQLWKFAKDSIFLSSLAHSRRSIMLWNHVRKQQLDYDLIIAHTLPALYPAWRVSLLTGIPFIFDVEDYHPGEKCNDEERRRRQLIMTRLLPNAAFLTCASPMICEYTHKLIADYPEDKMQVINNSFPEQEFIYQPANQGKIQFVWFSQNIAAGRGLELVIPQLFKHRNKVHLTLIGNLYADFYKEFLRQFKDVLTIKSPMPQQELNNELCKYDVGLAIELNSSDMNRQICLTNKIFAYAQAGLYILATDTPAQKRFISENQALGTVTAQTPEMINQKILEIIEQTDQIREQKKQRFNYARHLSWDREKKKIKQIWQSFA